MNRIKRILTACFEIISRGIASDSESLQNEARQAMKTAKEICLRHGLDYEEESKRGSEPDHALGCGQISFNSVHGVMEWESFQMYCLAISNIVSCRVVFSTSGKFVAVYGTEVDFNLFKISFDCFLEKLNLFYSNSKAKDLLIYSLGFSQGLFDYSQEKVESNAENNESKDAVQASDEALIIIQSDKLSHIDRFIQDNMNTNNRPVDSRQQADDQVKDNRDLLSLLEGIRDGRRPQTRIKRKN